MTASKAAAAAARTCRDRWRERERERDGVDEQWMMAMLEEWGEEMDRSSLLGRQPGRSSVGVE